MSVTEVLGGLGSWGVTLSEQTPDEVVSALGYFGHLVIVDGRVDVAATASGLLAAARYVGVCREKDDPDTHTRSGSGLSFWLGDEDGKGHVIETEIALTNATLAAAVAALIPPTVTVGTVFAQTDPLQRYTGKHVFQSRRDALQIVCDAFAVEYRVNPNFTVDVGTPAQLYNTASPDRIVKRRETGADIDLTAIGGNFDPSGSALDYSTRVVLMGQTVGVGTAPDTVFAVGSANAASVPYKDPQGNPVKFTRLISESGETTGSVAQRSQLQLNRFNRTETALQVTTDDFEIHGPLTVGDAVYVYDPETGMIDPAVQVYFRGQALHPQLVRVSSRTWPIAEGMTVAWRTDAGVWLDLTPWVVWEPAGAHEMTVGDLPKTLTRTGSSAVQDRIDAARDVASTAQPKAPTGLTLTTASSLNPKGVDSAIINAAWAAVTQNTDNTSVLLGYYEVSYRPALRAPLWIASQVTADTTSDLQVVAALSYDVRVRAVSTGGVASAWSATSSITSAADTTPPPPPADPVTSVYLGQGRIEYSGTDNTGAVMPADTNRIDVHVGTTSGFTPTAATRVDSVNPFAKGVAYATAPYGSARWAKLIAVDHSGNASAPSGAVTFTTTQVVGTDLAGNIIDLSKITFKDQGNLVEDGSFGIAALTAARAAASGWASVTGFDGTPAMQWGPGDGDLALTDGVPVSPGEQLMSRYMFQSSATGTVGGLLWLQVRWHFANGTTALDYFSTGGGPNIAAWTASTPWYTTVPANAVTADFYARVEGATAGTWSIDDVEVRKVIGTTLIQDAAIVTAKIANLAVNNAKIADLSVGKLTAGTMTADVVMAGRHTTALTGARREMNATGFQAFNSSNVLTINLDGTNNLLTGIFRTALSGRRIEIGASGRVGAVDFFAPDGTNGFVSAYTESLGVEAIQLGLESGTNSLWNRINYNTDLWANYRSNKHDFYFGNATGFFIVRSTTDKGVANEVGRLLIDSGGFTVTHANGVQRLDINSTNFSVMDAQGDLRFQVTGTDTFMCNGAGQTRFHIGSTDSYEWFAPANGGGSFMDLQPSNAQNGSSIIGLATRPWPPGGGVFAGKIKYWIDTNQTNERIEFRNGADSGFVPLFASTFVPSSDRAGKDNIRDLDDVDHVELVRGMRLRRWDERDHSALTVDLDDVQHPDGSAVPRGKLRGGGKPRKGRIGIVTQESPPEVVVDTETEQGVDLYALLTVALGSIQQILPRLEALEGKPPKGPK